MTYVAQMHKNTLEILLIDLRGKKTIKQMFHMTDK